MKEFDLPPQDYRREGETPARQPLDEPIFGPGAVEALGSVIGFVLVVALIRLLR